MKTRLAFSCGGVVFRRGPGGLDVVLAHYDSVWGLPKGTPEGRETKEQTALREVQEETGLEVEIIEPITEIKYWFVADGTRIYKTVYFLLMRATGGDTSLHDAEHEEVAWFPLEEAYKILSYPNELEVVHAAAALAEKHF